MSITQQSRFALITGATGGIGRALLQVFHDAGYQVIATGRMSQPVDLPCAHYIQADLGIVVEDETYAHKIITSIRDILNGNGLKVLINNAAIQILGGAESLTRKNWNQTLGVNLLAPFFLTQAMLPELESVNGCGARRQVGAS